MEYLKMQGYNIAYQKLFLELEIQFNEHATISTAIIH